MFRNLTLGFVAGYLMLAAYLHVIQRQMMFPAANWTGFQDMAVNPVPGSRRIALETTDGETLAAWYLAPSKPTAPVVLFFHGNGGGLEHKVARWADIAARGWGLLALSYRGYPGSTGTPSEDGLAIDARTAYQWLLERHAASRVVLHGFSLGTGVGVTLATEVDAAALILEAPFLSTVDLARDMYFWLPVDLLLVDQFRSDKRIADVRMPTLIVHGTDDEVVPFSKGKALFARAVEPKAFVTIEGGTHGDLPLRGLGDHIARFVAKHAPPSAGAPK